jgi:hypothetical protein
VPVEFIAGCVAACGLNPTEVVSGACGIAEDDPGKPEFARGIDGCGERWAFDHNIPIHRKPAKFKTLGRKAGPLRNREMAEYADALLLIWDGQSAGSRSMLTQMIGVNKPIYEVILRAGWGRGK